MGAGNAASRRITSPRTAPEPVRVSAVHRGITLVEVLVAAAILSVAAIAALELLAATDLAAREARRQAIASVEAERALSIAADTLRRSGEPASRRPIESTTGSESLEGCTIEVRAERVARPFAQEPAQRSPQGQPAAGARMDLIDVVRLVAEVIDEDGRVVATVERIAPDSGTTMPPSQHGGPR